MLSKWLDSLSNTKHSEPIENQYSEILDGTTITAEAYEHNELVYRPGVLTGHWRPQTTSDGSDLALLEVNFGNKIDWIFDYTMFVGDFAEELNILDAACEKAKTDLADFKRKLSIMAHKRVDGGWRAKDL